MRHSALSIGVTISIQQFEATGANNPESQLDHKSKYGTHRILCLCLLVQAEDTSCCTALLQGKAHNQPIGQCGSLSSAVLMTPRQACPQGHTM